MRIQWVNSAYCKLEVSDDLLRDLIAEYTFRPHGYKFHPKFKAKIWDGYIRLISRTGSCPVGLVPGVLKYCLSNGHAVAVSDEFKLFGSTLEFSPAELSLPYIPRDYQLESVDIALTKKRQTLLLATSAGKSLVIYMLARAYQKNGLKTLVIVPNVSLVSQLESDFKDYASKSDYSIDENCHFISAGVEKSSSKPIVVSTWQSLQALLKTDAGKAIMESYDAVIGDEVHLFTAAVLGSLMNAASNAFCRIGLSGTLDKTESSEQTIISHFGPVRRIITAKQLMDEGYATKAVIKPVILKYSETIAKAAKGLPYDDELEVIVKSNKRNRFLTNFANGLKGNSLLLFRFVDKHAEVVKGMILKEYPDRKVFIVSADTPKTDREVLRQYVEENTGVIIISTYALFSTGISIKNLDNVVFASPTASSIKVLQSIGRSLRKLEGKEIATIWDIVDDLRGTKKTPNHLYRHFSQRLTVYNKEGFDVSPTELEFA
jgi:superfamily II DNA or RNA helicase